MKEIILKVPEQQYEFFLELMKQLGIEISLEIDIPEAHKQIVRDRIKASDANPDRLLSWDEVKSKFSLDQ